MNKSKKLQPKFQTTSQRQPSAINFKLGAQSGDTFTSFSNRIQHNQHQQDFESLAPESLLWDSFSEPSTYLIQTEQQFQNLEINLGEVDSVNGSSSDEPTNMDPVISGPPEVFKAKLDISGTQSPISPQLELISTAQPALQSPKAILDPISSVYVPTSFLFHQPAGLKSPRATLDPTSSVFAKPSALQSPTAILNPISSVFAPPAALQSPTILDDDSDPYNKLESLLDPLMEAHKIRYSLPPRERRKLKSHAKFKHKLKRNK